MNFNDYKIKKLKEEWDEKNLREKKEKEALAKAKPHFKELIENIEEILKDGDFTCKEECKYGTRYVVVYKNKKYWFSLYYSFNRKPLDNEFLSIYEYDIETGKEAYSYHSDLSNWVLWHTFPIETCEDARLFVEYIVDNVKPCTGDESDD